MKSIVKVMALAMVMFTTLNFVSCKSGDATESASIIGKWQGYAISQDGKDWTEVPQDEMNVMDFHEDSTYTQTEMVTVYTISSDSDGMGNKQENVEEGTWSLKDNTLTLNESFRAEIVKLDKEEMVLTFRQRYLKYRRLAE